MKNKRRILAVLMLVLLVGNVVTIYAKDIRDLKVNYKAEDGGIYTMRAELDPIWYWGTDWCAGSTKSYSGETTHVAVIMAYNNNKVAGAVTAKNSKLYSTGYYCTIATLNAKADEFDGKHWVAYSKNGTRVAYLETTATN